VSDDPVIPGSRRRTARSAVLLVLLTGLALVLLAGDSVKPAGERLEPGPIRSVVVAVGGPTGWIAERLPFAAAADAMTGWLRADDDLSSDGTFAAAGTGSAGAAGRVAPEAFDARALGESPPAAPPLRRLLVTGDSMSMPLDADLARSLAAGGVRTVRDPHVGTGISKSGIVDWGRLAVSQAADVRPEAVVIFVGANEGFPMVPAGGGGEVACCTAAWAAEYATRVRAMVDAYRRGGARRIYWMTVPAARDDDVRRVQRVVNAALRVALAPYGAQVRVVDAEALFTPGGVFREGMPVDGRERLVRDPDGIHLNDRGAAVLADAVLARLREDFALRAT
jgi:lysophospholipase L1-like esterase